MERAFMFLEDGEWDSADEYCEKVLDIDPKCGEAYLGKLMAELHAKTREGLKDYDAPFDQRNNYQKAMRFGDEALQTELQGYIDHIIERNLKADYDDAVAAMNHAQSEADYLAAAKQLQELGDYADAAQLAEQCYDKAEIARKDALLAKGKNEMAKKLVVNYENAIRAFQYIPGWKDANEQAEICKEKLEKIKEEQRLREAEESQRKAEMQKKKKRRNLWILGFSIIVILLWTFVFHPWISYQNGNYRIYINRYNITEFTIPDGVTEIKEGAFRDCDTLTSITIPDGVTAIGERAFAGCGALKTVEIPDSVTTIGDGAFSACISLESVTIGNGVTSLGSGAFMRCKSLTSVTIGSSVTIIEENTFESCEKLAEITIPPSVTAIGENAFHFTNITVVRITDLAAWCDIGFYGETVDFYPEYHDNPLRYGDLYLNGCLVTELTIPDGVTAISDGAFYKCNTFTSVTIPDGVTSIGKSAFHSCDSLTTITIPDSVTFIGVGALSQCDALSDIYYDGTVEQWQELRYEDPIGCLDATVHCSDGNYGEYH